MYKDDAVTETRPLSLMNDSKEEGNFTEIPFTGYSGDAEVDNL